MFFDQEVMFFDEDVKTSDDIITLLAKELQKNKIVTDEFLTNALQRETNFPTGLFTEGLGVAIPHTDSQYVNKSQIAFASLKHPVTFKSMVDINEEVPVKLVFMIAMASPHEQAGLLSNLMDLFQDRNALLALDACTQKEKVIDILHKHNVS